MRQQASIAFVAVGLAVGLLLPISGVRAEGEIPLDDPAFWLRKAEAYAAEIQVPDARAAILVSTLTGYVEAGLMDSARWLGARALEAGKRCKACLGKTRRLAELGVLLHRAGDPLGAGDAFDQGLLAADEILDAGERAAAMARVAELQAETGDLNPARIVLGQAMAVAAKAEGLERVEAYAALVGAYVALGDEQGGRVALTRLGVAVGQVGEDAHAIADETYLGLTDAWGRAGERELARSIVESVRDPGLLASGLCLLARIEKEAGAESHARSCLDRALGIARSLEVVPLRVQALAEVARAAERIEEDEVARLARMEVGATMRKELSGLGTGTREATLAEVLLVQAALAREAGNGLAWTRATSGLRTLVLYDVLIEKLEEPAHSELLRAYARELLRGGQRLSAQKAARRIEDPFVRAEALLDLAGAQHAGGQATLAAATARSVLADVVTWPDARAVERAETLRRIVVLQAACGRFGEAAQTLEQIDRPFQAATACTYVAYDLSNAP